LQKAALIGFGYWGPNLARNIKNSDYFELTVIIDENEAALVKAKKIYPEVNFKRHLNELNLDGIDVAFIATPAVTHSSIAEFFLTNQKNIWVEKPATLSLKETQNLIDLGAQHNKRIFVDHPYAYSPEIEEMASQIASNKFGKPLYFESQRSNLGIFQPDVSVLWDLAVHDLSIIQYCIPDLRAEWVSCTTSNPLEIGKDSTANLNIGFKNSLIANVSCNWLSPIKVRRTFFIGSKKSIIFDETSAVEKIKIYSQEFSSEIDAKLSNELKVSFRIGEIVSPRISPKEPLSAAIEDFGFCLKTGTVGRNELVKQLEIITILELAEKSSKKNGERLARNE
jgi:predicted dehydrogenase